MPDQYGVLKAADIDLLRSIALDYLNRFGNPRQRPAVFQPDYPAPDVYIAFTPSDGIPGQDSGAPGKAECDIYIIEEDTPGSPQLVKTDFTQIVYNFNESGVDGETYILIARDKHGNWCVAGGGGSGMRWVRLLCINRGCNVCLYPGLLQIFNTESCVYADEDHTSTTIDSSALMGTDVSSTPASMDNIIIGNVYLVVDGLCDSQAVKIKGNNTTASGTATVSMGEVTGISITSAGSGYSNGTVPITITGDGSGASGTATISGGAVTSTNITNGGSGYTSANVTFPTSPATPTSFTADFACDSISHGITGVTITDPGSGFAAGGVAPTVSFSGGGGTGATGTVTLDPTTGDFVSGVTITNSGHDYTSPPSVVFDNTGTTGSGETATATVSGPITLYLHGVWVYPDHGYFPVQNDVDEPVTYLARHEKNAPDGLPVYDALAGDTLTITCIDGTIFTFYAGRLMDFSPGTGGSTGGGGQTQLLTYSLFGGL
jgi:hypothetical protein